MGKEPASDQSWSPLEPELGTLSPFFTLKSESLYLQVMENLPSVFC